MSCNFKKINPLTSILFLLLLLISALYPKNSFAGPQSTNYNLIDYAFGSGGTSGQTSTNYGVFAILGETDFGKPTSTNYGLPAGLTATIQANVPPAPTFTNPSNYYNKLNIVLNTGGNPTDTQFAVAISPNAFATTTNYIQADNTIGSSPVWQTNTVWGASGFNIINLNPGVTYTVKVSARQGNYTQSAFGPTAQAATVNPTLAFDIDVAATDTETAPPYSVNIGTLTPATVTTATNKIWVDLDTNGTGGGSVYVYDANSGLNSSTAGFTISAVSNDLTSVSSGYGARSNSVTQSSGGPMEAIAPYNGAGANVGILDTTNRLMFDSTNQPVTAGRVSFELKAKPTSTTPAAGDYQDTLTIITSASF